MNRAWLITGEKQAEIIAQACKENGLDGHIKWIRWKKDAGTRAEQMARDNKVYLEGTRPFPVKNSYMYCDSLDMCFFFLLGTKATLTYSGRTNAGLPDIKDGKIIKAFEAAQKVLDRMEKLATEEEERLEKEAESEEEQKA